MFPSAEISLRKATLTDAPALVFHNLSMARETENLELDSETVHKGVQAVLNTTEKGFYLLAEQEGATAGSLMITYEWSDWRNAPIWWIQSVYVRPEFRKQGIYQQMYRFIREMAAEAGVSVIRLYVEESNHNAQAVYEKLGMHVSHYLLYEAEVKQ